MFDTLFFKMLVIIVCLALLAICAYYLWSSFIAMFKTQVPYVPSFAKDIDLMNQTLKLQDNKSIVDLGCGDGKVLRLFDGLCKAKKLDGYEINGFAVNYGKVINGLQKKEKINLYKKNFMSVDISGYDYIYVYLMPDYLAKIESWLRDNMGDDTIIISNTFTFKNHLPYEIIRNKYGHPRIHLYRK